MKTMIRVAPIVANTAAKRGTSSANGRKATARTIKGESRSPSQKERLFSAKTKRDASALTFSEPCAGEACDLLPRFCSAAGEAC